jgi:hypothetical protein
MIVTGITEVFLVIFYPVGIEGFSNDTGIRLCVRSSYRHFACTILNMEEGEFSGLGLIGCGMMGGHYADAVGRIDGAEIIACCDPTVAKLKEFSVNRNIGRSYLSYRKMIAELKPDGIFNVTPDYLHFETASAVLEAGIPLMTEKPLAVGIAECLRLKKIARKATGIWRSIVIPGNAFSICSREQVRSWGWSGNPHTRLFRIWTRWYNLMTGQQKCFTVSGNQGIQDPSISRAIMIPTGTVKMKSQGSCGRSAI